MKTLIIILLPQSTLYSQTFLLQEIKKDNTSFEFKFQHPFFDYDNGVSALTGIYELSAGIRISDKIDLKFEIPITHISFENIPGETEIGNIFLGIQARLGESLKKNESFSAGIFISSAAQDFSTVLYGIFISPLDMQKYLSNELTIFSNYSIFKKFNNNFKLNGEIGPNIYIYTGKGNSNAELYLHFGFSPGFYFSRFFINTELAELFAVTADSDVDFSDRFINCLAAGFGWEGDIVRPRIFYTYTFNEFMSRISDGTLGLKLEVILP